MQRRKVATNAPDKQRGRTVLTPLDLQPTIFSSSRLGLNSLRSLRPLREAYVGPSQSA